MGGAIPERFVMLDGLRGIAALAVLLAHVPGLPHWLGGNAWMAVDFFFMLSGFVLAHVYEARLREPGSIRAFLRDRVIRLHPLLILAALPGACFVLAARSRDPYPWLTAIAGMIPFPALWKAGPPQFVFPLNLPSWSLFWELVVNIAFAFAAPLLRDTRALVAVVVAASVTMTLACIYAGGSNGTMATAGTRAFACFAIGVLLLRAHRSERINLRPVAWLAMPALVFCLFSPLPGPPFGEHIARFLVFPFVILALAGHAPRFPALCTWVGELSYPLYILQLPLIVIYQWLLQMIGLTAPVALLAVATIPAAWAIGRWYDVPVRACLRRRFGARRLVRPAES